VCYEKRIIVEVDGGLRCVERDGNRDWRLEVQGFKVLRFWNNEVLNNRQGGLEMIREYYLSQLSPNPSHQERESQLAYPQKKLTNHLCFLIFY
ncbi:MAG: DUF559 domain-containing protein, partial [Planctomycetota bacterium]